MIIENVSTPLTPYTIDELSRETQEQESLPEQKQVDLHVVPSLTSFDWNIVLGPENFPRTIQDGRKLVEKASNDLRNGIKALTDIPLQDRTFENTVMAYHDLMTDFDAVERLIRSERLISDQAEGKTELLAECIQEKEDTFSDVKLINAFISYAAKLHETKSAISPAKWTSLKGIIYSIDSAHLPQESVTALESLKTAIKHRGGASHAYLPGACEEKVLPQGKKELSLLTVNLCLMPKANSMIYGGVLPWTARIDAIAEKLKALDADVVCLQEVYDVRALSELQKRLSPIYAHFYGNVPLTLCGFSHASLFASSGLAVISKCKIDLNFEPFTSITHEDKPSGFDRLKVFGFDRNYGIFHGYIRNGNQLLAHLAVTHENPFYADIRQQQTKQIVELFEQEAKSTPHTPRILCGDLNIEQKDLNEGGERLITDHFVDHYDKAGGPTWDDFGNHWCHKWHGENAGQFLNKNPLSWTVDRVLPWMPWAHEHAYKMEVKRISMHGDNPELALTDHHGLLARITC